MFTETQCHFSAQAHPTLGKRNISLKKQHMRSTALAVDLGQFPRGGIKGASSLGPMTEIMIEMRIGSRD